MLKKAGATDIEIHAFDEKGSGRTYSRRLAALAQAEKPRVKQPVRRARKAVASALLGMIASALPNGFGDFGVVSGVGRYRAARTARLDAGRRPPAAHDCERKVSARCAFGE
jgi:hypothetical protein